MKRAGASGENRSARQQAWSQSAACADAAKRGSEEAARQRETAPKCGAKRKSDGRPCEAPALANGRCRVHGGLTPSGAAWHTIRYPAASASAAKVEKKLQEIERRERRRRARVAGMTPEERARYEQRRRAMRPRSVGERTRERQDREASKLLSRPAAPAPAVTPESEWLRAEMRKLDAEETRLTALLDQHGECAEQTARSDDER